MNTKNDVEVIINGKQYTISGYESSDYLQRIATHINDKYAEFRRDEGYSRLDAEMRNILLAINLSDDYYKVQESVQDLQREKEDLEKEIFNMKHDMIAMKAHIEDQDKKLAELKKGKKRVEHEIIRLATELKNAKEENETLISFQNMAGAGVKKIVPLPDNSSGSAEKTVQPSVDSSSVSETVQPSVNNSSVVGAVQQPSVDSSSAAEMVQQPPVNSSSAVEVIQPEAVERGGEGENTLPEDEEGKLSADSESGDTAIEEENDFSDGSTVTENDTALNFNKKKLSRKSRKKRKR